MTMMDRLLYTCALLVFAVALVSCQRSRFPGRRPSDNVDPAGVMGPISDRTSIRRTASGLPRSPVGRQGRPLSSSVIREVVAAANRSVNPLRGRVRSGGQTRAPLPRSFPFGPQLLSSDRARAIGRAGRVYLEAARQLRERSALSGGGRPDDLPILPAGSGLDCPFDEPVSCDPRAQFRTITGVCNNLRNPRWGSSNTPFERNAPSVYNDGLSDPRSQSVLSGDLPLPRAISTSIHQASNVRTLDIRFTQITMEFGQFVSHDIERFAAITDDEGAELVCCDNPRQEGCFPLDIPANDPFFAQFNRRCMEFVRAQATPPLNCQLGPREQLNQESAYLDASAVYGSTVELANDLRLKRAGLLKTVTGPDGELLQQDPGLRSPECRSQSNQQCFKAGDPRVNQQPALMSMHTIWLREHNRVARELRFINPSWDDERLYQEARKIVSAEFQHVVYDEFLPVIVGNEVARAFDFPAKAFGYNSDYDETFNAQIRSSFSAAGYRFGHSLVQTFFAQDLKFRDHFLRPDTLYQQSRGPSFVIKELFSNKQQKCDRLISPQLTNTLFEQIPGSGIDLAATNIHRGRDFGIPSYNLFRVICGLSPVTHFGTGPGGLVDHTPRAARLLQARYSHVDDIDLFTGAVAERVIRGAVVGPTIACVVGRQFFLLKKGDRFFYENDDRYARFPLDQLNEIRKTSLARIICDNTNTQTVQRQAFRYENSNTNPTVACSDIPSVDLTLWRPCVPVNGGWSAYTPQTACFSGFKFQFRRCDTPRPSACGQPCTGSSFRYERCGRSRTLGDPLEAARRAAPAGLPVY